MEKKDSNKQAGTNGLFKQFYKNIQLTDSQKEDAKRKYTGVCKTLHTHYYDGKYTGDTKLLFGSYGKHTHIRPARDIDVLFKLPDELFSKYDGNPSNGQSRLLQDMKNVLKETYPKTEIKADGKVVTVHFSEGSHNVEVLPAWENPNGTFRIPDTSNGGRWENGFDPKSEIKEIQNSEEQTSNTRFLIRVVKKWSENCSVGITSHQIEKQILSFLRHLLPTENYSRSHLVRDFFEFASTVGGEKFRSHFGTAYKRANKALDFEEEENMRDASIEWRKVFGDDFPKLDTEDNCRSFQDPRPIDFATATPPYYNDTNNKYQGKYQLTKDDLKYMEDRGVQFIFKNREGVKEILERNYFYCNLPFHRKFGDESIQDSYYLKIDFNFMEEGVLPQVFDMKKRIQGVAKRNNIKLEDMHVYDNMRMCITLPSFAKEKKMRDGFDLKIFFEDILEEVLYWHAYYERHGKEPWSALSHGEDGKAEAMGRYNLGNRRQRRRLSSGKKK